MFSQARYRLPFFVRTCCMAMVFMLVCSIVTAHVQDPDPFERRITITLREVTLREALNTIQDAANVKFAYSTARINLNQTVSVDADNVKLREVLNTLLGTLRITFKADSDPNTIVLSPVTQTSKTKDDTSSTLVKGNGVSVAGMVTDATTHETLPGVNVLIKGTANGVTTDAAGKYAIQANDGELLVFSFIGYKPFEVTVGAQTIVDVALESEAKALEEFVVNAGYYNVLDKEKTGSISRVSSEVIERQPVVNPLQAMQGRMPGIEITQFTGVPGSNFQVRIRGTNSLSNSNNPLYVIDGVPFISDNIPNSTGQALFGNRFERGGQQINGTSPLTSINPNDIESIEVLKDADATAIYGSRGANGVVLIATKRGKAGKVKLTVDVKSGASVVQNRIKMLDTEQYIAMRKQAVANDGDNAPRANEYDINGTWDQTRYTNWQDVLIGGTAQMTDMNASITGGNNETQFVFGLGYNKQGVVFPGANNANRFSTHFSVSHATPDKRFNTRLSTNYSVGKSNIVSRDLSYLAVNLAPNAPKLYTENGEINWENSTWENPLAKLANRYQSESFNLITNAEVSYEIVKGLRIKSTLGLSDIRTDEIDTYLSTSARPIENRTPADSRLTTGASTIRSWIVEPQLNYENTWSRNRLNTLVGGTYQNRNTEWSRASYGGFPSNAMVENPNAAIATYSPFTGYALYKYVALYGRLNYSFNEKYFLNLTGRRDGSSRFGPGKKFANLGAVGAAWIFSNETFVKNHLSMLSFGKLRGSYGFTGNDQIGDYRYVDTYAPGGQYQGVGTLQPNRLYNPEYGWEVNKKMEVALELGFFNDNVLLTTAWYRNRSSNQLIDYQLAGTTGFPSVLLNSPAVVQNTGMEFEVNTTNINKGSLTWTTSFNITFPKNKLVAFENLESSSYANVYVLGQPLTIRKAYHYIGVNPTTGFYEVEDVNNDGEFTPEDQTALIIYAQKFYGGLNNSISFKGLQLDVFFQFVKQQGGLPGEFFLGGLFDPIWGTGNVPVGALEGTRWQAPGDIATKQHFTRNTSTISNAYRLFTSDAIAGDIYFLRLKNISISYQLPATWLRHISSRLYVQAQNLLTFTNYKGLDPETGYNRLPPLTTFVAGLQLTF